MNTKLKRAIKDLPKVERPREKLIQYGPERLSNSELLVLKKKAYCDKTELAFLLSSGYTI